MDKCIFCSIVSGEIPGELVAQSDNWAAFRDIHPLAPVHVLIVPKKHIASLHEVDEKQAGLLAELLLAASSIAEAEGVAKTGYRVVTNVGPDSGQVVFHLHFHLLGGRRMGSKLG